VGESYTLALVTEGNSGTGYLLVRKFRRSPYNSEGHSTLACRWKFHRGLVLPNPIHSLGYRFSVYSSSSQFLEVKLLGLMLPDGGGGCQVKNGKVYKSSWAAEPAPFDYGFRLPKVADETLRSGCYMIVSRTPTFRWRVSPAQSRRRNPPLRMLQRRCNYLP
jgi:hypothetical protein